MKLLKLIHPVYGVCAQVVIFGINTEHKIKKDWKYRYGKKFYECTVEEEVSDVIVVNKPQKFKVNGITKVTATMVEDVLRLLDKGYKYEAISRQLNISKTTVGRINNNEKRNGRPYYFSVAV